MAKKNLPRRKELARVCFQTYGDGKLDRDDLNHIIENHEELLIDCGFVTRDGVISFAIKDMKDLKDEFFQSISTRRMAAAVIFQTSLNQGVAIQQQMYENVVDSDGSDTDSVTRWNQTTDTLAKLTGAYAPEKTAEVSLGEADEVVSIADVVKAREKVIKMLPEGDEDEEEIL